MLIQSITRDRLSDLARCNVEETSYDGAYWFSDKDGLTIAVVKADAARRWGYVCLSRDGQGSYRSTRKAEGFATRETATRALYSLAAHLG
jgi:hypothetical protein